MAELDDYRRIDASRTVIVPKGTVVTYGLLYKLLAPSFSNDILSPTTGNVFVKSGATSNG